MKMNPERRVVGGDRERIEDARSGAHGSKMQITYDSRWNRFLSQNHLILRWTILLLQNNASFDAVLRWITSSIAKWPLFLHCFATDYVICHKTTFFSQPTENFVMDL